MRRDHGPLLALLEIVDDGDKDGDADVLLGDGDGARATNNVTAELGATAVPSAGSVPSTVPSPAVPPSCWTTLTRRPAARSS
jgi:hypothetical protein